MAPRPRRARRPGRLSELGFVRDYPGMAYYAGWSDGLDRTVMDATTGAERWRRT